MVPPASAARGAGPRLGISVVFTSPDATAAALKTAQTLSRRLRAKITLVVPVVVSYQLPIENPAVPLAWSRERLLRLVEETGVDADIRIYTCRDLDLKLAEVLKPHSLVVVGREPQWWRMRAKRLARRLRRQGHEVILAERE